MAEILTQRALVLAEIESTFGTLVTPSPTTDAYLVQDPDFSVDITTIERNFARQSISPLPVAAGRKIATMTFGHEVRNNGDTGTAPRIGKLLRACGMAQTQVTANGATNGRTTITADAGNSGDDMIVGGTVGGTNSVIDNGSYRIRIVTGGGTGVAEARITGGIFEDDQKTDTQQEKDAVFTETFCVETVLEQGTITGAYTVDDATDPTSVEYDFSALGGLTIGDQFRVTVLGIPFLVTVTVATATGLGDDVVTAVSAHPDFGASNAAGVVDVTFANDAAAQTLTSGSTVLTLGASGHTITIDTFTTADLNDAWTVATKPIGFEYAPISTSFESVSIFMYFDGVLHRMGGSRGTFTVEGNGGELALFNFEMQGNFVAVIDAALPAATFETTIPVQVELARLRVNPTVDQTEAQFVASGGTIVCDSWENEINGSFEDLCAAGFTFDIGNEVVPRECINDADSFKGVIITSRQASGTMDPEMELVATHDFWNILATADVLEWQVRVGTARGNVVRIESNSAQYSGLSYADRNGLRVLEVDLRFSASAPAFSDDEVLISFN